MKTILALAVSLVVTATAHAANIVIKNDTATTPKIEVFQNSKRIINLKRFKPGDSIVVPVNEKGKKPLLVITNFGHRTSLFLPVKPNPLFFQFSWLQDLAR